MFFGLLLTGCTVYYSWIWTTGIFEYMNGTKHVAIVGTAIVMIAISFSNLVAFYLSKKETTEQNGGGNVATRRATP